MTENILVIDDDLEMLKLVQRVLAREGYQVETISEVQKISIEKCQFYDLLIVDVMMPEEDGFSFVQRIRKQYDGPILFLTAKTESNDLIRGLSLGADDYIKKPFDIQELRARVSAHLRREHRQVTHSYLRGDIRIALSERVVYYKEQPMNLTKSEYLFIEYLAAYPGQVYTKEQLYEKVFGYEGTGNLSAITEHIKNIRHKFNELDIQPIETVWGVGYKWVKLNIK